MACYSGDVVGGGLATSRRALSVGVAVLCGLAAVTYAGCGITTLPFLDPPIAVVASTVDQTFQFDGLDPTDLNFDPLLFEGYELYYRFFANSGEGPTDLTSLSLLTGAGFQRLHQAGDTDSNISKPLVGVVFENRSFQQSVTVTFRFGQMPAEPWVQLSIDHPTAGDCPGLAPDEEDCPPIELRRATTNDLGHHELISDTSSFDVADSDVAELFAPPLTTINVALLLYALTYGRDFSVDVHSAAVYLGEIIISFP